MAEQLSAPGESEAYAGDINLSGGVYFDDNNYVPFHKVENNLLRTVNKLVILERDEALRREDEALRRDQKFPVYLNSRAWTEDMDRRMWAGQTVGVVFMDFDGFKNVNDTLGHPAGDDLIASFGEHMNNGFRRETDSIGIVRDGGDEFWLSFSMDNNERRSPNPKKQIKRTRKYLRNRIQDFIETHPDQERLRELGFGVSMGMAINYSRSPRSIAELKKEVDDNMYKEKRAKHKRQAASLGRGAVHVTEGAAADLK